MTDEERQLISDALAELKELRAELKKLMEKMREFKEESDMR